MFQVTLSCGHNLNTAIRDIQVGDKSWCGCKTDKLSRVVKVEAIPDIRYCPIIEKQVEIDNPLWCESCEHGQEGYCTYGLID